MNGEELQSLKELLDERFTNLHSRFTELREDTKAMSGKLDKLPCGIHNERIKGINGKLIWIFAILTIIIGALIRTGLAK